MYATSNDSYDEDLFLNADSTAVVAGLIAVVVVVVVAVVAVTIQ